MAKSTRSDERGPAPAETEEVVTGVDASAIMPHAGGEEEEFFDPSVESIPEELVIPYMRLAQGLTQEVKDRVLDIGDNVSSLGVNFGKWFKFIPLWYARQAMYYDRKAKKLICRSEDGVTGTEFGPCADCDFNYLVWPETPEGRKPPTCTLQATFPSLIYESEKFGAGQFEGIVAVQFTRSSFPVAKKIITTHDQRRRARGRVVPYYSDMWRATSTPKMFNEGEANVYQLQYDSPVPNEVMRWCSQLAREWVKASYAEPPEDPFAGSTAADEADGGRVGATTDPF